MNHVIHLQDGIESWNRWRAKNAEVACDLSGQDLRHRYFFEGDFSGVNFKGADLRRACLIGADLRGANLQGADLTGAYLGDANLYGADLSYANLTEANLDRANLRRAELLGTQIVGADLRTAQLPDPTIDPYAEVCLSALNKTLSRRQMEPALPTVTALSTAEMRRSLLQQMMTHLQSFTRESPQVAVLRQQAIRQSATPLPHSRELATVTLNQPANRPIGQQVRSLQSATNWGRRELDKRFSARIGRQISRPRVWIPAVAASLLVAVGLPVSLWNINAQSVVAQSSVAPLALAKSLTGSSQVWTVATHQVKGTGKAGLNNWVIGGGSDGRIEIWDAETGDRIRTIAGHSGGVRSLAVSDSGQWLISGGQDGLKVWQLASGSLKYSLPEATSPVWSVAISPDEQRFVSSDDAGKITTWDLNSGKQLYSLDNDAPVWSVAIAPDGQSFVGGSDDSTVRQWDLATGELLQSFVGHEGAVGTVAISPDGKTLASGSWDKTIKLWDLATGLTVATLDGAEGGHRDRIVSLAISPDGKTLASGSRDSTVKLWDLPNRQLSTTLKDHRSEIYAVAFDPQGETLVSGGQDRTVKVWQ